jgi:DNA-binding transcriptional MerR regulator
MGFAQHDREAFDEAELRRVGGLKTYSISELAREFKLTLRALRFYEDRGLLSPQRRGVTRIYDARDRARLAVIVKGKNLGFTLAEIERMLGAPDGSGPQPQPDLKLSRDQIDEQIAYLERQKAEVEAALEELRAQRRRLTGEMG